MATRPRPLSPHLTIWRWGPHMVVSILHRATGVALSIAGLVAQQLQIAIERTAGIVGRKPCAYLLIGQPLKLSSIASHSSALRHSLFDTFEGCSCRTMVKTRLGEPSETCLVRGCALSGTHLRRPAIHPGN